MIRKQQQTRRAAVAVALSVTALGASGCGGSADDSGDDVGESQERPVGEAGPYAGPYDEAFIDDAATLVDAEVTLTAQVEEVVSPVAFTITEAPQAEVEQPGTEALLVVNLDEDTSGLDEGDLVEVTGTYREVYNVPAVEENLRETPGVDQLAHYDGEPFIEATDVEATDVGSPGPAPATSAG